MDEGRLIVYGNVQGVGYRAYVKLIARAMGVDGSTRNLDDGTVEIYFRCPVEKLKPFKAKLTKKASDPTDPLQIDVTEIKEFGKDSPDFDSKRIGHPFEVVYDSGELKPFEKESLERSEMAILVMTNMNINLSGKIDDMHHDLGNKIETMDNHMNDKFDWLAEKYAEFGDTMKAINEKLDTISDLQKDFHEMKEAFLRLTDHVTNGGKV